MPSGKFIPSEVKAGGAVVGGIIELVFTGEDIYRFYQKLENEEIDEDEFNNLVCKRIIIAVIGVVGGELGSIAGLSFGGPVGMVIGGIFGNIFGKLAGRAMGEAVVFGKDVVLALLERYGGSHLHKD